MEVSGKKKKYERFRYTQQTLETALSAISKGELTLSKASTVYGIPKATLFNKINHKVPWTRQMGPSTELTFEEEKKIAKWILDKAKLGFPMHPDEVYDTIEGYLNENKRKTKFTDNRPGKKWLQLFLKRHPDVTKRNAEYISKARAAVTEASLRNWFSDLSAYLKEENALDIKEDPSRIFNTDETGVVTCPKTGLILGPKNYKDTYVIASGKEKESITVLCTFAASGKDVPPFVVYPYKRIPAAVINNHPDAWFIGRSDSGWMVSETFYAYIKLFHEWLLKEKIKLPILLLLDGHKSHINQNMSEFCKNNGIFLFCLYPNATHILQPCDVAIFRPIKLAWKKIVRKHKQSTTAAITKQNFAQLFEKAYKNGLKTTAIQKGFRKCGLYPMNPDAVDYSKCIDTRRKDMTETGAETNREHKEDLRSTIKIIESDIGREKRKEFIEFYQRKKVHNHPYFSLWAKCKSGIENQNPAITKEYSNANEAPLDLSNASSGVQDEESTGLKTNAIKQSNPYNMTCSVDVSIGSCSLVLEGTDYLFDSVTRQKFNNTDEVYDFIIEKEMNASHVLPGLAAQIPINDYEATKEAHGIIPDSNIFLNRQASTNGSPSVTTPEEVPIPVHKETGDASRSRRPTITELITTDLVDIQSSVPTVTNIVTASETTSSANIASSVTGPTTAALSPVATQSDDNNKTSNGISESNLVFVSTTNAELLSVTTSDANYPTVSGSSATFSSATCSNNTTSTISYMAIASTSTNSAELDQFLKYPSIPKKKPKNIIKKKEPMPYALTGQKYKEYVKKLDDEKKKKEEETEQRKLKRLEVKKIKQAKKRQAPKNNEATKQKAKRDHLLNNEEVKPPQEKNQKKIVDATNINGIDVIGKYVVAQFKTPKRIRHFVGKVLLVDLDEKKYKIDFLRKKCAVNDKINFIQPQVSDITEVAFKDIVRILPQPSSSRRGMISFADLSFTDVE